VLTCEQVVVPQQPVGGHAVDDLRQLRPVQALALDDGIAAVVGELYAVDGVRLQAQQLRRWRNKVLRWVCAARISTLQLGHSNGVSLAKRLTAAAHSPRSDTSGMQRYDLGAVHFLLRAQRTLSAGCAHCNAAALLHAPAERRRRHGSLHSP